MYYIFVDRFDDSHRVRQTKHFINICELGGASVDVSMCECTISCHDPRLNNSEYFFEYFERIGKVMLLIAYCDSTRSRTVLWAEEQ